MKIGSLNINGVNAFANSRIPGANEFFDYFAPDILCLQETKGDMKRVTACLGSIMNRCKYIAFVAPSLGKSGYAGVALLIKSEFLDKLEREAMKVYTVEVSDFMDKSDPLFNDMRYYGSGRIIVFETEKMIVVSVYTLNSGGKDELRKLWDVLFLNWILSLDSNKSIYIMGDLNVCHTELDMWNWNDALNTSPGLMQFEIDGFSKLLSDANLKDSFRELHPSERRYSWSAPKVPLSKGWRLDYALTNDMSSIKESYIYPEIRCSDHVCIEIELL